MAKLTEKRLYETWLDIHYAAIDSAAHLVDMLDNLKIARKLHRGNLRNLKKAADHYEAVYGNPPKFHK